MGNFVETVVLPVDRDQVRSMMSDARFFDILGSLEGAHSGTLSSRADSLLWTRSLAMGPVAVVVEDTYQWTGTNCGTFTSSLIRAPMGIAGSLQAEMTVTPHEQGSNWTLTGRYSTTLPLVLRSYESQIERGLRSSLQLRVAASRAWSQLPI